MKINKNIIFITSLLTLLPIVMGGILWNRFPSTMATHFNLAGSANGYNSKAFTVFGLPFLLFFVYVICLCATNYSLKKQAANAKISAILLWIFPFISIVVSSLIYTVALGYNINIPFIVSLILGIIFIILGNYMPKIQKNFVMGVRTTWALKNADNWKKTQRLTGKLMVVGGFIILITAFFHFYTVWLILGTVLLIVIVPLIYSYLLHLKNKK